MSEMNEMEKQRQWAEFQEFQKQQKKKGKKKWLWGCGGCLITFIILAIIFSACSAIFVGSDGGSGVGSNNKEYKIGETAKNGDLEVTVNSVEITNQVGPSVLPTTAKDTFVVADVTVKNNANDSLTIDSNMFKLKSGEKTANADSAGSVSANQSEDGLITDSFFLEQVNPDSTTEGKIAFDVSENFANAKDKKLIISSRLFSSNNVVFDLNQDKHTSKKNDKNDREKLTVNNESDSNNILQNNDLETQQTVSNSESKTNGTINSNANQSTNNQNVSINKNSEEYQKYLDAQALSTDMEQNPEKWEDAHIGGGPGLTSPSGESFDQYQDRVQNGEMPNN